MDKNMDTWQETLSILKTQMTAETFRWLRDTEPHTIDGERWEIATPSETAQQWLEARLRKPAQQALKTVIGKPVEIHFIRIESNGQSPKPKAADPPPVTDPAGANPITYAKTQTKGFTILFDVLVQEFGKTGAHVYGLVWRHCQMRDENCSKEAEKLGAMADLNERTVRTYLNRLVKAGYLRKEERPGTSNIYHLTDKIEFMSTIEAKVKPGS